MLTAICQARLEGLKVILILDEAGLYWAKIDTVSKQAREMAKLVLVWGKLHANAITISHQASDLATAYARTVKAEFEKTDTKNAYVNIQDGIKIHPRLITSIPATTLLYDPDAIQWFDVNMVCAEIFEYMSRIPEGTNQWEALLKYIPTHTFSVKEDWIDSKDMAQALKAKGMSQREIAKALNEPKSSVARWTSEQKLLEDAEAKRLKQMGRAGQP
jgi:DNA-binding transcriptional regulator YiaG